VVALAVSTGLFPEFQFDRSRILSELAEMEGDVTSIVTNRVFGNDLALSR
jgi:hypothetical protein